MTKIYLITHLDSGMKYVGITDGDLAKRWQQHYNDPNSAVYTALRSEGYRMTMELLEEVPSRDEALRKEQEYIRTLGTAHPHGWNRMVSKVEVVKKWVWKPRSVTLPQCVNGAWGRLKCPSCNEERLHFWTYDEEGPQVWDDSKRELYMYIECEKCHHDDNTNSPPLFHIDIKEVRGYIYLEMIFYVYVEVKV